MNLHLIWDLDGTLINSEPEIKETVKKALLNNNIDLSSATKPLRIGPPLPKMLRAAFSEDVLSDDVLANVVKDFRQIYDNSDYTLTVAFSGIDDVICDKSFCHHIVTNKPDLATNRIVKKLGWTDNIIDVLTSSTFNEPKTKTELFALCANKNPNCKFVGIGDMAPDCVASKNNNMTTIGVRWGTGTKEELESVNCDYIVNTADELLNLLNKIN